MAKMALSGAGLGLTALASPALARPRVSRSEALTIEADEQGGHLNYMTWPGYDADSVLEPFQTRYNCEINCDLLTLDPVAIRRLKAGATRQFHLITLNNCWAKDMFRDGLIVELDNAIYRPFFECMISRYRWPFDWAMSPDDRLLGIPQRYGPYNFVINKKVISKETAQSEGWNLFLDPKNKGRWALLSWDNWVLYHICQSVGVYPFKVHTDQEMAQVGKAAYTWFRNAKFHTENEVRINQALVNKEIGWYCCGGIYTSSPPRRSGRWEIEAVTPRTGAMAGGKGGIVWTELTSIVNNPHPSPLANDFLAYMQEPEASYHIAMAESTHNPIANMASPHVMKKFSYHDLKSIQFDTLEEDMSYCEDYNYNPDFNKMMRFYRRAKAAKS